MQLKLIEYKFQGKKISELEHEIDELNRRNEFLEAETKKFKTILGFGDVDINEQLKKKLVDNAVLNLSARFLQNGWQLEKSLSKPKDISALKKITKSMERLAKPVDAMKIRLNLRTFFEELKNKLPAMIADYEKLYNKPEAKPMTSIELRKIVEGNAYLNCLQDFVDSLRNLIEKS